MDYLNSIDNTIDNVLDNDVFYSGLIILLIIYCTFCIEHNQLDKIIKIDYNKPLIRLLIIVCIIYFSTKDIRLSLLLLIIFLIELDKIHSEEIKGDMLALLITDAAFEKRIADLEKK